MTEQLKESKDNLLALRVYGEIKKDDYDIINPAMDSLLKRTDHPKMLLEVGHLKSFTPKAFFEDLKNLPDYNKFDKMAVIGDKGWKETLIKVFGKVVKPKVEYFNPTEKNKALHWLKE